MKKFKVWESSPLLTGLTILFIIFGGMAILIILLINHIVPAHKPLILVLFFLPTIFLAFLLPRYTATAIIEISIDDVGIKTARQKQFLFQNRPDIKIGWIEVYDYVFEPDRQFDKFKMTLKDGMKIKFYHNNNYNGKDDFLKFLNAFEQKVKELNSDNNEANDIKRGKTIYETTLGLVLAGFAVLVMIAIPVLLITIPRHHSPNYAGVAIAYGGMIFYLVQVIIYRTGNNKS